jgi:steroid 5-alpha reductase family enzyme
MNPKLLGNLLLSAQFGALTLLALLAWGAWPTTAVDHTAASLLWALLAGALLSKALLEARWMTQKHPDYAAYMARSGHFIPCLL